MNYFIAKRKVKVIGGKESVRGAGKKNAAFTNFHLDTEYERKTVLSYVGAQFNSVRTANHWGNIQMKFVYNLP